MSIVNLVNSPDKYSSVNAPMIFEYSSASYSTANFKYISKVYAVDEMTSVKTLLGEFDSVALPYTNSTGVGSTGNGIFQAEKILRTQVSQYLNPIITGATADTKGIVKYQVDYGYQQPVNIPFFSTGYGTSSEFPTTYTLTLDFSATVSINTGDTITVDMFNTSINPTYNTTGNVLLTAYFGSPFNTYIVLTDIPVVGGTAGTFGQTGSVIYQKVIVGSVSNHYGFNATRQYTQRTLNFGDYVQGASSSSSFLSYYTDYQPTLMGDYETMGFLADKNAYLVNGYQVVFADINKQALSIATASITLDTNKKWELGVGTQNLINAGMSIPTNAYYYAVQIGATFGAFGLLNTPYAIIKKAIDRRCTKYTNVQLAFLNRLGSFEYWDFNEKHTKSLTTQKILYKQTLAPYYNIGDRVDTYIAGNAQETQYVSSNWITQYDSEFLREMITSLEAFEIQSDGTFLPIIITDTSYTVKTKIDDKLFCMSLTYNYGYQVNLQSQ